MTSALLGRARRLLVFTLALLAPSLALAASELPESLVLQFEPSAASLDQAAIRLAVERELGRPIASSGADDAATLTVGLTAQGEVEVRYRPERARNTRTVPLTETRDVPRLVAHLAGNMVRDQAGVLIEQLSPAPGASLQPASAAPSPTTPSATPSAAASAAGLADEPTGPGAPSAAQRRPEYLRDRWLTSLLLGASFGPNEGASLTLAQSRRWQRFEFGLGIEAGAARADARLYSDRILDVSSFASQDVRVTLTQLTIAVGADVRLLGRDDAQLQVGCAAGYRIAGIVAGSKLSGSNGDFALAPRVTAVFKLRGRHSLLLRGSWYVTPRDHTISSSEVGTPDGELSDGIVVAEAFDMAAQAGYQVGF